MGGPVVPLLVQGMLEHCIRVIEHATQIGDGSPSPGMARGPIGLVEVREAVQFKRLLYVGHQIREQYSLGLGAIGPVIGAKQSQPTGKTGLRMNGATNEKVGLTEALAMFAQWLLIG